MTGPQSSDTQSSDTQSSDPDRSQRFAGRRIYLTGAASGIGLATAQLLARQGAALALVDVQDAKLAAAAAGTGGLALTVDLRDGDAIDRSIAEAAKAMGGIDGVVNCAGVPSGADIADLDPAEWERVLAINLTAPFRICRAAAPWLRSARAGAVVNVASGAGLLPTGPGSSAYSASKGGLIALTKAMAKDFGPSVRVNAVCPGVVETPMTEHILHGMDEAFAAAFVAQYTLKRVAAPTELAEAIAFLLSDEASFITGATLPVDGGRVFH